MKFTNSPLLSQLLPAWRARFVAALILLAFGTLAARSVYLQVVRNDFLQQKGESRYARVIELSATRGRIADRSGDMLAVSTPVKSVWAIPEDARLSPAQARELAALLEMDVRELNRRLAAEKDFVFIKRQIPPDVAEKVAALALPGIHHQREYRHYYPAGEVTAHMLGFTGVDDRGQEGIELAFDVHVQNGSFKPDAFALAAALPAHTPEIERRMVVLPAPLAPSTVTMLPRGTSRLTLRMAWIGP